MLPSHLQSTYPSCSCSPRVAMHAEVSLFSPLEESSLVLKSMQWAIPPPSAANSSCSCYTHQKSPWAAVNCQTMFRLCSESVWEKWKWNEVDSMLSKGRFFVPPKGQKHTTATENVPSHLGTSPLCAPTAFCQTVWGELKPNTDHVKSCLHEGFPVPGSSSHVIYDVFFYLHSTKPRMSFYWLDDCGLPLLI